MGERRITSRGSRVLIVAGLLMVLGGCTVGPNFVKPKGDVPEKWSDMPGTGVSAAMEDISRWWTLFKDPALDSLIVRAIESNKDLKLAGARIREARAQRGVVAAGLYPTVDVSGGYSRSKSSNQTSSGGGRAGQRLRSVPGRFRFQLGIGHLRRGAPVRGSGRCIDPVRSGEPQGRPGHSARRGRPELPPGARRSAQTGDFPSQHRIATEDPGTDPGQVRGGDSAAN